MKKIVDIDKWKEFVKDNTEALHRENFYYAKGYEAALVDATELILDMPDAEEVKHGKWFSFETFFGKEGFLCSACDFTHYPKRKKDIEEYKYCPNCGAKMDLGEEE